MSIPLAVEVVEGTDQHGPVLYDIRHIRDGRMWNARLRYSTLHAMTESLRADKEKLPSVPFPPKRWHIPFLRAPCSPSIRSSELGERHRGLQVYLAALKELTESWNSPIVTSVLCGKGATAEEATAMSAATAVTSEELMNEAHCVSKSALCVDKEPKDTGVEVAATDHVLDGETDDLKIPVQQEGAHMSRPAEHIETPLADKAPTDMPVVVPASLVDGMWETSKLLAEPVTKLDVVGQSAGDVSAMTGASAADDNVADPPSTPMPAFGINPPDAENVLVPAPVSSASTVATAGWSKTGDGDVLNPEERSMATEDDSRERALASASCASELPNGAHMSALSCNSTDDADMGSGASASSVENVTGEAVAPMGRRASLLLRVKKSFRKSSDDSPSTTSSHSPKVPVSEGPRRLSFREKARSMKDKFSGNATPLLSSGSKGKTFFSSSSKPVNNSVESGSVNDKVSPEIIDMANEPNAVPASPTMELAGGKDVRTGITEESPIVIPDARGGDQLRASSALERMEIDNAPSVVSTSSTIEMAEGKGAEAGSSGEAIPSVVAGVGSSTDNAVTPVPSVRGNE